MIRDRAGLKSQIIALIQDNTIGDVTPADVRTVLNDIVESLLGWQDTVVIDCGTYDASIGAWPTSGGTGTSGAPVPGNMFDITVDGTIDGIDIPSGCTIRMKKDGNWRIYY